MMKISIAILTLFLVASAHSQAWDPDLLEKANTAKDIRYLKEDEKKVIFYTNLARIDGQLFADTYLKWFLDSTRAKTNNYIRSLNKDLKKVKNLPVLYSQNDLFNIGRDHAIKSGKTSHEGHRGFKSRFKPVMGTYNYVGENCYYGSEEPVVIVIKLLIDEGVKDLGHRHNMLEPSFNSVGVAIKPHKQYGYNCVMDFGAKR